MFPINAIPVSGNTKFQTFYASGTDWQAWQKPAGCSMVYIFMLAAGGGGSRTPNGNAGPGASGGGGGSGGASRMLIPAALLPDTIWVQPGAGGLGATTATTAGGNGATSYVGVQPNTTQANTIFTQAGGSGGLADRTGGTAGAVGVNTGGPFGSLGLWYSIAGQGGFSGASALNGVGGSVTPFAVGIITSSGAGGSNGTSNGGQINPAGLFLGISGGIGASANGRSGFQKGAIIQQGLKTFPLLFSGGSGGAGGTTGTSGNGGDAAYGGGGGGGGGASGAAGTSGNGGNGGDGFIIIGTF